MSLTQQGIAFSGSTPQSRHSSYQGAKSVEDRQPALVLRYLGLLKIAGEQGVTDQEAALRLGCKTSSICGRRNECLAFDLVEPCGFREGDSGVRVTAWRLAK